MPFGQALRQFLARHLLAPLIKQYDLLIRAQLIENMFAFRFTCAVRFVTLAAPGGNDCIQAKLPLARISAGVSTYGVINPGWLTIADSNESDMHGLAVGSRKTAGQAQRPEFLQIIELTHLGQHDVHQCILQVEQHPFAPIFTFNTDWPVAGSLRFL